MVIENMPGDMTNGELEDIAKEYGKILKVCCEQDAECTKGTIVYENEHALNTAIEELDGRTMEEWPRELRCFRSQQNGTNPKSTPVPEDDVMRVEECGPVDSPPCST